MVVVIGELAGDIGVFTYEGSSPRMRGTHSRRLQRRHPQGIIPAYAGTTWWWNWCPASRWDHPRVCGEHACNAPMMHNAMGSSPRMRGTHHTRPVRGRGTGIIPAYAGNTHHLLPYDLVAQGSSPRMRGTPRPAFPHQHLEGIIPAYAGNTPIVPARAPCRWDHPRVCGEHV